MRIILLLVLLILTFISEGQNIQSLDRKYGFNKFKLESPISTLRNNLKIDIKGDKVVYYRYIGTDIKTIFNSDVDKIVLGYYNSRLYFIKVTFKSNTVYPDLFKQKLIDLFGKPTNVDKDYSTGPLSYNWGYAWQGKKVHLRFDSLKSTDGEAGEISLWLKSEIIEKLILNQDF